AQVAADDLPADNRLDQIVEVRDRVRVLVVDGAPNDQEPEKAASYFLMHGLLPVTDADRARYPIEAHLVTPRQAAPQRLKTADLCILTNVLLEPNDKDKAEALSPE